jgi:hypothetical protein
VEAVQPRHGLELLMVQGGDVEPAAGFPGAGFYSAVDEGE